MADQSNRGVAKVLTSIVNALPAHNTVQASEPLLALVRKHIPRATEQSIVSGLSYLKGRGVLNATNVRGVYSKPNGRVPEADMELVVIDNLLAAMAAAEPVLKECKKIITMIRAFK